MHDNGRLRQAQLRANAQSWIEGIVASLGLVWWVIWIAPLIEPLLTVVERYRVLCGILEVLGGLALVYWVLIQSLRRRPLSWPTSVSSAISAAAFTALTYGVEARLFPMLPNPGDGVIPLGVLLLVLPSLLRWINRRTRGGHRTQVPANPA